MSDVQRRAKVKMIISRLVQEMIPPRRGDDHETTAQRSQAYVDTTRQILSRPATLVKDDTNHVSDQIRRMLMNKHPSLAQEFSNLYSLLLAIPVLRRKWGILFFFWHLADSPNPHLPLASPMSTGPCRRLDRDRATKTSPSQLSTVDEEMIDDAFAIRGLRKLPKVDAPNTGPIEAMTTVSSLRASDDESGSADTTSIGQDNAQSVAQHPATPKATRRDVALKSTLLAASHTTVDPPETDLLRDLPYTLQGLSSTCLPFVSDGEAIQIPISLPVPFVSLLHTLAEPSLLYRRLENFVHSTAPGLLGQSLRAAVDVELRSYLILISTLESQIRRALASLDFGARRQGIGLAGVTLKRCVVWTRDATMGLRLLSLIAEESQSKRGGQLISLIHSFASTHGDPTVASFADRLLTHFTRPFYSTLRRWIYDGELLDPHLEFFVREHDETSAENGKAGGGGSSVWENKYRVEEAMTPSIVTHEFAQKVFRIGKALNFIRHDCSDSTWVDDYSKAASRELQYGDTATLEASIDEAHETTMRRLIDLMATKFHLFDHLCALKKYMLLGQGDFIGLLVESLAADLNQAAGAQYRHTLTAQLDHAIRGSNAQFDSAEVLRRLDARMLHHARDGDIGWDCFTLEYKVDGPVDVVVTDWGARQYLKIFNFLWRIKRVDFALASTWHHCMTGSRGVLQHLDGPVAAAWKATRGVLAEMVHFVGQLQYYLLFEVIESSWGELQARIARPGCTLDGLIQAHTHYLTDITTKGLLGSHEPSRPAADDPNSYVNQLDLILKTMLEYHKSVEKVYGWIVEDFARRQRADIPHPRSATRPALASALDDLSSAAAAAAIDPALLPILPAAPVSEYPTLQKRLRQLALLFREALQYLLADLASQPNVDLRFLGVVMNFNDVYQPRRRPKAISLPSRLADILANRRPDPDDRPNRQR